MVLNHIVSDMRVVLKKCEHCGLQAYSLNETVVAIFHIIKNHFIPGGCRYTEYTDKILDMIDILVDGRFIEEKKNINLNFRGSENQRIIEMPETRDSKKVILSKLND